jgi:hypothetical protein
MSEPFKERILPNPSPGTLLAVCRVTERSQKGYSTMSKTVDIITDVIRNAKHPFRQVDDRPDKQKKNRYERRKVKEIIKLSDWSEPSGA